MNQPSEDNTGYNNCLFVVNPNGILKQLHVPFRAKLKYKSLNRKAGSWVFIEEVKYERPHLLLYRVDGEWWYYGGFKLFTT